MRSGRCLTVALTAAALSLSTSLAGAIPAGAASTAAERSSTPDAALRTELVPTVRPPVLSAPPLAASGRGAVGSSARAFARPLFAFWGQKHNRIDGFSFTSVTRGSGTGVQIEAAWKTYSGVKPILPKVFVQARVDGGRWTKVKGVKARIGRRYVVAQIPARTAVAGVAVQTVDYRLKSKKLRKGPRRGRRSVSSDQVTVRYDNQSMYTGDQARFYAPIASLCPNASVTIDTTNITGVSDGVIDWQYGITIDAAALAAAPEEPEVSKLGIAIHECAHMKQFYNWGGTNQSWTTLIARSAEVFVADSNPDPAVQTTPMKPDWSPLEHAADCAKELISSERYRTYGGYCSPTEYAAAGMLWQNQRY